MRLPQREVGRTAWLSVTDAEIECASPVTYAPRGTSTMVSCRYTLAGVAHVRARPGVHLAAQHIQVGFRPDLGVRWLLCSRAPSGAHLAELATLLLAGGDAVGSDIILTEAICLHVGHFSLVLWRNNGSDVFDGQATRPYQFNEA